MSRKKLDLALRQELMRRRQLMGYEGTGRPPKFVDPELVYHYAGEGASDVEIAARVGVTVETLRGHFDDLLGRARARFTVPIKLKLLELAFTGNFRALRFALELYLPDGFSTNRRRRRQRTGEGEFRNLQRFASRSGI